MPPGGAPPQNPPSQPGWENLRQDVPVSNVTSQALTDKAVRTARRWAQRSLAYPEPRAAKLLASALDHPEGLRFTLEFVDGVLRPEDPVVAAKNLGRLARQPVPFLPPYLRAGLGLGVAPAPRAMLPTMRRAFSLLLGDLVVDIGSDLGPALARLHNYEIGRASCRERV